MDMSNRSVYLCGPITGITYEEAEEGWRVRARKYFEDLGIEVLSPLRGKYFLKGQGEIRDSAELKELIASTKGIVTRDKNDCFTAGVVLANLTGAGRVSIGSMFEYGWASAWNKPIVTIIEPKGNIHEHSFIREVSGFCTPSEDEAYWLVASLLNR